MRKYQRNPVPELSKKRSEFVVSVAMFYGRAITIDDIAAINPHWCRRRYEVQIVIDRLINTGFLVRQNDAYQLTGNGYRMHAQYMCWKKIFGEQVYPREGA